MSNQGRASAEAALREAGFVRDTDGHWSHPRLPGVRWFLAGRFGHLVDSDTGEQVPRRDLIQRAGAAERQEARPAAEAPQQRDLLDGMEDAS